MQERYIIAPCHDGVPPQSFLNVNCAVFTTLQVCIDDPVLHFDIVTVV